MKKLLLFLLTTLCCLNAVYADNVRLVVPLAAGATMDDIARTIAPVLSKKLDKNIVVENRPGAAGGIGMLHVASSPADGLTLVVTNNGLTNMLPLLNSKVGYTSSSFASVGLVGLSPLVLVTGTSVPASNLKELTEQIKNNPGKASWASPGTGTSLHLLGELLKGQQDLDMVHIQYKTMSQAMIDVSEGRVTMMFDVPNSKMFNFFEVNKMKPMAVTGNRRVPTLPGIPTVNEQGFAFLNAHVWFGVAVPADTPAPILDRLRNALNETLDDAEVSAKLKTLGIEPSGIKPIDSQKYIESERVRWTKVIKNANIKPE